MNYNLTLKGHFDHLTSGKGHDLIGRSCCISVDPYGRPEHSYGVFIDLAGLYRKLLPKTRW